MNLIVMLTYNDQTVTDAIEVFRSVKDLPVQHWGFKNIGLPVPQMKALVRDMKDAGKTVYLEVVTYTEEDCLAAAELAIECGFDCLMGTLYYPSIGELVKGKIKYFPFCGHVWGNPSILGDDIDGIIADALHLKDLGCDGLDLLAYRFTGDAEELIREFAKKVDLPTCIAGSIDSDKRLDFMKEVNPDSFTMGSALFNKEFIEEGSFRENLQYVCDYLKKQHFESK
jgi:hypothetical protein